jgi:hypothetical protein
VIAADVADDDVGRFTGLIAEVVVGRLGTRVPVIGDEDRGQGDGEACRAQKPARDRALAQLASL